MIIPIRALARVVLGLALDGARDTAKKEARKRVLESQFPAVKALLAEQLA
jgi:hypothetical protein